MITPFFYRRYFRAKARDLVHYCASVAWETVTPAQAPAAAEYGGFTAPGAADLENSSLATRDFFHRLEIYVQWPAAAPGAESPFAW